MNINKKLYTTKEAAAVLQVDVESVRRYVRSGELKSVLLGKKFMRIEPDDLQNFIQQRKASLNKHSSLSNPKGVKTGNIWHSPLNVYWHLQKKTEEIGESLLEADRKYQNIREARVAAVVALAMYRITNRPAFIQLYRQDPPDALIMQPSFELKGQMDITQLEITSYMANAKESLLEQLKRKKIPPNIPTYSPYYILVVNIYKGVQVNFEEVTRYLVNNKTQFPVWTIQEKESHPDTVAELVILNPELQRLTINIGESAYLYKKLGLPDVLHTKRIANPDLVRMEKTEKFYNAPWEMVDEAK